MARGNNTSGLLEREREKVREVADEGKITTEDRDAILELAEHGKEKDKTDSTVRNHILQCRKTAERAGEPLLSLTNDQLDGLFDDMRAGRHPDVKDSGIKVRGYQGTLRVFYRYHGGHDIDPDEIEFDDIQGRNLQASDLLYESDVDELLRAAQRQNPRDAAMIALALATGQRIDALRTLRLKHVHQDGPTMEIELNESEGALKGASGRKPLLWAKHWVRQWFEAHPYKGDPDAALFCTERKPGLGDPDEPMSQDTIRRTIRRRADDADIDKDVYPHLLRHTAITRMVIEGLSEQKIKKIVGWSPDSSRFATYVHLADELTSDSVREELDVPTSDSGTPDIGRPPVERCVECNDMVPDGRERCPTCQTPFSTREAVEGGADTDPTAESILEQIQEMDDEERNRLAELLNS